MRPVVTIPATTLSERLDEAVASGRGHKAVLHRIATALARREQVEVTRPTVIVRTADYRQLVRAGAIHERTEQA